jgi:putative membrane protein
MRMYGFAVAPFGWLVALVGLILFVALIVAVVWAVGRFTHQTSAGYPRAAPQPDAALAILRERFARGEISQAEFEEAKRILGLP